MGLKDTLELIISADVKGAVSGFESVGASAEKNLTKTTSGLQAMGGHLQVAGAAMVGIGVAAVAGLGKLAEMGEDAHQVDVKLAASVDKAGAAAGGSVEPFKKLAEAMQKKVAFDDEAIKTSESLQLQVGLTGDQVLKLTPLIADLAAKEGVDLVTATGQVTKALNGKKKGLEAVIGPIDAARYATDKYGAVQDALNAKVGGFAEVQGKSFSGQLEIMKNRLMDIGENVGQGAVQAFSTLFDGVDLVTGGLEALDPSLQSTIGEFATFGAVGLIAVGAVTTLTGTIMKQVVAFKELAVVQAAASNPYAAMAVGVAAVSAVLYEGVQNAEKFAISAQKIATIGDDDLQGALTRITAAMDLTGTSAYDMGRQLAEQSVPQAIRMADALDATGRSSTEVRQAIGDVQEAHAKNAEASAVDAQQTADLALADDGLTQSAIDVVNALHDQADALKAQFDPLFAAEDGAIALMKAQDKVAEAQANLTKVQGDSKSTTEDVTKAANDLSDAQYASVKAAEHNELAMNALAQEVQKNPGLMGSAIDAVNRWEASGAIGAETANKYRAALQNLGDQAHALDGTNVDLFVNTYERTFSGGDGSGTKGKKAQLRAGGGPVMKGEPYIVGENHAELFIPSQSGYIDPLNGSSRGGSPDGTGGGAVVVNFNGPVFGSPTDIANELKRINRVTGGALGLAS